MNDLIKQVFLIVGTMVASLLLYMLVFGDAGRDIVWSAIEPVYINEWDVATFHEGNQTTEHMNDTFNKGVDISE